MSICFRKIRETVIYPWVGKHSSYLFLVFFNLKIKNAVNGFHTLHNFNRRGALQRCRWHGRWLVTPRAPVAPIGRRAKVRSIARPRATPSTRQNLVRESTSSVASVLSKLPRTRTACAQTSPSSLFLSFYLSVYPHNVPRISQTFSAWKIRKITRIILDRSDWPRRERGRRQLAI